MAEEQEQKPAEKSEDIEKTIDPYTGELKPVPEDADRFIEVVPESTDDRGGQNYLLNEETSMDAYAANADADAVAEQSAHYTEDEDIEEDFADRQRLAASGRDELLEELENHHSLSPAISGGDLDASWQTANQAGEETVGGSVSTPDQDVVDELGQAAGLSYRDNEPLDYDAKVLERDRDRWELNPASAQDEESENEEDDESLDDLEDLDDLDEDDELDEEDDLEEDELFEDELDDEEIDDLDDEDEDDDLDAELDVDEEDTV
jgi:hypothetical protein